MIKFFCRIDETIVLKYHLTISRFDNVGVTTTPTAAMVMNSFSFSFLEKTVFDLLAFCPLLTDLVQLLLVKLLYYYFFRMMWQSISSFEKLFFSFFSDMCTNQANFSNFWTLKFKVYFLNFSYVTVVCVNFPDHNGNKATQLFRVNSAIAPRLKFN